MFTIGFDPKESFFIDSNNDRIEPVSLEPLTITIDAPPPPTFEVKAVKVNDVDIPPTDHVTIDPGDIVELNIFGSDWSPEGQRLKTYHISIDCEGLTNEGSSIGPQSAFCHFLPCDHISAFIDENRADYVYFHLSSLSALDLDGCFRYSAVTPESAPRVPVYQGIPKYFATLILETFPDICGSFQIDLLPSITSEFTTVTNTEMFDINIERIRPLKIIPLTLDISVLCSCPLRVGRVLQTLSFPPNCAIDARDSDGAPKPGWRVFSLPLQTDTDCKPPDLSLFELNEFPLTTQNTPNSIIDVGTNSDTVSVLLRDSIQPGRWTCLDYHGTGGGTTCIGRLPGDVNNDSAVLTSDVNQMMKCLSGETLCKIFQCDIDRNNTCSALDLLHLIDLMNGANGREVLSGTEIADGLTCPSQVP